MASIRPRFMIGRGSGGPWPTQGESASSGNRRNSSSVRVSNAAGSGPPYLVRYAGYSVRLRGHRRDIYGPVIASCVRRGHELAGNTAFIRKVNRCARLHRLSYYDLKYPQLDPAYENEPVTILGGHFRASLYTGLWRLRNWVVVRITGGYSFQEVIMTNHAVSLKVTPCLRIECKFWLGDDGWKGSSEHPSITVQAGSFEQAKADMEFALGKHLESLLERTRSASQGQAA